MVEGPISIVIVSLSTDVRTDVRMPSSVLLRRIESLETRCPGSSLLDQPRRSPIGVRKATRSPTGRPLTLCTSASSPARQHVRPHRPRRRTPWTVGRQTTRRPRPNHQRQERCRRCQKNLDGSHRADRARSPSQSTCRAGQPQLVQQSQHAWQGPSPMAT